MRYKVYTVYPEDKSVVLSVSEDAPYPPKKHLIYVDPTTIESAIFIARDGEVKVCCNHHVDNYPEQYRKNIVLCARNRREAEKVAHSISPSLNVIKG